MIEEKQKAEIFISHAGKDNLAKRISGIAGKLEYKINQLLVDDDYINGECTYKIIGENYDVITGDIKEALKKEVAESSVFLAMLSENYTTDYCVAEAWEADSGHKYFKLIIDSSGENIASGILPNVTAYDLTNDGEEDVLEQLSNAIYVFLKRYYFVNVFRLEPEIIEEPTIFFAYPAILDEDVEECAERIEGYLKDYAKMHGFNFLKPPVKYYELITNGGRGRISLPPASIDVFIQLLSRGNQYSNLERLQNDLTVYIKNGTNNEKREHLVWMSNKDGAKSELRDQVTYFEMNTKQVAYKLERILDGVRNDYSPEPEDVFIDFKHDDGTGSVEATKLEKIVTDTFKKSCVKFDKDKDSSGKLTKVRCETIFIIYGDVKHKKVIEERWHLSKLINGTWKNGGLFYVLPHKDESSLIATPIGRPNFKIIEAETEAGVWAPKVIEEIKKIFALTPNI